jgi:hypothetical protein
MIEKIERAISEYNRYHGREAVARLVGFHENRLLVEFSGPFCYSCGMYDYFEDLIVELEGQGIRCRIAEVRENDTTEVVFSI